METLEELETQKSSFLSTLNILNNVSQKALGFAPNARENLAQQKTEFNKKLSDVNLKIIELENIQLQNTEPKANIEPTANIGNQPTQNNNDLLLLLGLGGVLLLA